MDSPRADLDSPWKDILRAYFPQAMQFFFPNTAALIDWERQQILDLYRFVDWATILPEALEREFWQELQTFEEESKVTYVTNAERFGFERGIQEGEQRGERRGEQRGEQRGRREEGLNLVFRLLTRRIGSIAPEQETHIRSLSLTQLEDLGEALLDFTQPADLDNWLGAHQ